MKNTVSVTYQSHDGDTWITSHFSAALRDRMPITRATFIVEVMKMWLLLSVPFGMSSCLFITLMVFDLLDPDRKADEKREVLPEAASLPQQDIVIEDAIVQTPPNALLEPVAVDAQI